MELFNVFPTYEIRVRGRLSDAAVASFEGMRAQCAKGETMLYGPVADQVRLHALLERVQDLGLELLEVRRIG